MSWDTGILAGVLVLVVLTGGLVCLGLYMVWRHGFMNGWRASGTAVPRCPSCGYNMSGLTVCRCPECGREFKLEQCLQYTK